MEGVQLRPRTANGSGRRRARAATLVVPFAGAAAVAASFLLGVNAASVPLALPASASIGWGTPGAASGATAPQRLGGTRIVPRDNPVVVVDDSGRSEGPPGGEGTGTAGPTSLPPGTTVPDGTAVPQGTSGSHGGDHSGDPSGDSGERSGNPTSTTEAPWGTTSTTWLPTTTSTLPTTTTIGPTTSTTPEPGGATGDTGQPVGTGGNITSSAGLLAAWGARSVAGG